MEAKLRDHYKSATRMCLPSSVTWNFLCIFPHKFTKELYVLRSSCGLAKGTRVTYFGVPCKVYPVAEVQSSPKGKSQVSREGESQTKGQGSGRRWAAWRSWTCAEATRCQGKGWQGEVKPPLPGYHVDLMLRKSKWWNLDFNSISGWLKVSWGWFVTPTWLNNKIFSSNILTAFGTPQPIWLSDSNCWVLDSGLGQEVRISAHGICEKRFHMIQ